jgi:biopolymer transport protein ExbB/TolQ
MRPLRIDFARSAAAPAWAGWGLLAVSLVLAGLLAAEFRAAQTELARLNDRVERLRARESRSVADPQTARQLREELQRARAVTQQLSLPWGRLFQAVESAASRQVALIALQPESGQGVVRITAEARDLAEALEFVRRLQATRQLGGVHLASHQVRTEEAQRPVRFVVLASLLPEDAS